MHRQSARITTVLSALLTVAMSSCSGSNNNGGGDGTGSGPVSSGACAEIVDHVRSLYQTASKPDEESQGADKAHEETRQELIAANVHMVVRDCETAPKRFIGCIRAARTVAEIEADCVIPLDDEGLVEGRQFQPR